MPRRGLSWGLIPAVVALGLLFAVGTLWTKNQGLQHKLESLARLYRGTGEQLQQANERLRLLSAPDAVQVSLSPQSEPRKPHATAIYSPSQRE